ncbi:esterase/lipase family protein [Streptomyces sp. NPDC101209]|uniref:esterase/lipase family protein n=1 Tax=Streptomyces sp. NPDC101209 TaxID=3366129 RepID=UPI00382505D5
MNAVKGGAKSRPTEPVPVPRKCRDAVIVVPGIMGSELVDTATGAVLWGVADPRWYVSAWTFGDSLKKLAVHSPDPATEARRIKARRLLQFPAFMPVLAGLEPYTELLNGLRSILPHPDALLEFAYDWRLPAAYNARLLAEAVDTTLSHWRRFAASRGPDGSAARAVIIAHSMGGLVVREMARIPGALDHVRSVITLGTPFQGTLDAVEMLVGERRAPFPLPRKRLRRLAQTLPAVRDMLPTYPCVDEAGRLRELTAADLGLDTLEESGQPAAQLPGHICVVGLGQPTHQSLTVNSGQFRLHRYLLEPGAGGAGTDCEYVDHTGDGTVYRCSAEQEGAEHHFIHQAHGALARCKETVNQVTGVLTRRLGPSLGGARIGLDAPDTVARGETFTVRLTGQDATGASCVITDIASGRTEPRPRLRADPGGGRLGSARLTRPGLYYIRAVGGGGSSVSRMLLVPDATNSPAEEL